MPLMRKKYSIETLSRSAQFINLRDRLFHPEKLVQAGKTPFNVVSKDAQKQGMIKLRHYPALDGYPTIHRIPVVIIPPLAINTLIYDLFENRSLVRFLLEQGFSVYMLDWGTPTREHARYNMEQYVLNFMPKLLAQVRQHSGQNELSLHSWSMSGVFTLLYAAAAKDDNIKNIIVLGTPIDAHRSGTMGERYRLFGRLMNWVESQTGFHPRTLPPGFLHSAGWRNALGFKLMDPIGTLKGHFSMLRQINNREAVESHATHGAFLNHMVDYPGGIIRDMIKVWLDNALSRGEFKVGGKKVYFKDIHASLLAAAGHSDSIVTVDAVRPLVNLVGTEDATFTTVSGGHVSMIAGEAAAKEFWPVLAEWLAKRSD
jgi:polyhydroxyalkanoate synthase subunit PhaC